MPIGSGASTSTLLLNMDGADGQLTKLTGHLSLNVFDFVTVSGDFGIEKKQTTVHVADLASTTNVDKRNLMVFLHPIILRDGTTGVQLSGSKYNYMRDRQLEAMEPERFAKQPQSVLPPPPPEPAAAQ